MGRTVAGVARRSVAGLHLLSGLALTARPRQVAAQVAGPTATPVPEPIPRVLGVRMLLQGLVEAARPGRRVLRAGALIDATHAASMIPAAAVWPSHRRAAIISGAVALTCSALAAALASAEPAENAR